MFRKSGIFVLLSGVCLSSSAMAAVTTADYKFDVSDTFSLSGTEYGSVSITADSTLGIVTFAVDAFDVQPAYGKLGKNFGIHAFALNLADDSILGSVKSISKPSGWSFSKAPDRSLSIFGEFDGGGKRDSGSREDPLVFSLILKDASLADASNFVSPTTEGYLFTAKVAGFKAEPNSHWIGVGDLSTGPQVAQVPLPGAVAIGLLGLACVRFTRSPRRAN